MTQYLKSYPVEPKKNKLLLKMTPVCLMLVLGSDDRLLYIYISSLRRALVTRIRHCTFPFG